MEHLFAPYDVSQAPGQLLPFSLYQIDQSNRKPTISPQQPQKWMGGSSLKAHPHPRYRFGLSSLFGPTKEAKAPTPTSSVAKPKTQTQNKTILRNPEKAPRGCPAGHWWCKTCSKYLTLEHFNPSTKAMQYKYLCANCETKTKQDQAVKFKRGRDGTVNPKHPRRVGAQNKSMKEEDQQLKNGLSADDTSKPLKKRRRRGRQWGSVQKLVKSFDPDLDWRLVVLGMRNETVHYASNFKSGKEFATQDLLIRFRHWVTLQDDGQMPQQPADAQQDSKAIDRMEPEPTANSAKMNLLLQRIQNLGVQQRLVSQELDDCLCALVNLQRTQGFLSTQPLTRVNSASTSTSVQASNTCPVRPSI